MDVTGWMNENDYLRLAWEKRQLEKQKRKRKRKKNLP